MSWVTLKTTRTQWEAELMQQILAAHDIPARIVSQGLPPHFGSGTPTVLQVQLTDQWTALLLLSPIEEKAVDSSESALE